MVEIATNIMGILVLLVTAIGAYYSNGLRGTLEGSELANVWRYMGYGVVLLFVGAIIGGISIFMKIGDPFTITLFFMFLSGVALTMGLKMQLDKVK